MRTTVDANAYTTEQQLLPAKKEILHQMTQWSVVKSGEKGREIFLPTAAGWCVRGGAVSYV